MACRLSAAAGVAAPAAANLRADRNRFALCTSTSAKHRKASNSPVLIEAGVERLENNLHLISRTLQ